MSAIGYSGQALRIIVAGVLIAAVRTKRVAHANTAIDITEGEFDGFRRILEASDTRTVDVQVEGVATIENWPMLRELWLGQELPDVQVQYPDGSAFNGPAFLSSLEQIGESGGVVAFSATLLLSGSIEQGLFLTSEVYATSVDPPPGDPLNMLAELLALGDTDFIGYGIGGIVWAGPQVGELYFQPLPSDTFDVTNFGDITGDNGQLTAGFNIVIFEGEHGAGPVAADAITSVSINGQTYLTAEADNTEAVTWTGRSGRVWSWSTPAGLEADEEYFLEVSI